MTTQPKKEFLICKYCGKQINKECRTQKHEEEWLQSLALWEKYLYRQITSYIDHIMQYEPDIISVEYNSVEEVSK